MAQQIEMAQAEILQRPPSQQDFEGINACKNAAWVERRGIIIKRPRDLYPYHAFSNADSWAESGELGQAILNGDLYVSVVRDDNGEIVAHAALVRNKLDQHEVGRVFGRRPGNEDGVAAVEGVRQQAEAIGVDQVHMGVSYNRTAMWGAFRKSFMVNGWQMAVLGLLPDIYNEHGSRWGEIMVAGVKDKPLVIPQLAPNMPDQVKNFVLGMQAQNSHVMYFDREPEQPEDIHQAPYDFAPDVVGLGWQDVKRQQDYLGKGYRPVGITPIHGAWNMVMYKGKLPPTFEGRRSELGKGRSPVAYPKQVGNVNVSNIIQHIYQQ